MTLDGWQNVNLAEILTESRIPVNADNASKRLKVRLHVQGVCKREERATDRTDATMYFQRRAGQFIYGKQNLHKGAIGIVPDELDGFSSTQDIPAFDISSEVDAKWLFYYFSRPNFFKSLEFISTGTGSKRIQPKALLNENIQVPPLPEQKKIAAILNSVDDAIQATQAVIDQTQRVKQGLLQHLLTRGIGHTRFKQTEIGEIPESWNIQKLRFLLSEPIKNGYSPICPKDPTGNWILNLSAVSPNGLNVKAVKPAPKNDLKVSKFLLHSGDFLVSRSNTRERVGFSIMYRGEIENCSYPDLLMRFRIDNRYILDEFLENYLTSSFALGFLQRAAAGTSASMVKINKKILESLPVLVPPIEEQRNISTHIQITKNTLKHLQDELLTFSNIKRGLMQDLLTGRVRVNCAE